MENLSTLDLHKTIESREASRLNVTLGEKRSVSVRIDPGLNYRFDYLKVAPNKLEGI